MRILVNALPLRHGGGVTYLQQQLTALARVDTSLDLHTLVSPWIKDTAFPGAVERIAVGSVPRRFAYEQVQLPFRRADVLYCPANFAPMASRAPIVLTLHNPNYYGVGLQLPETVASRPFWKVKANHWAMRRADVVVAISESMAAEVVDTVPSVEHKLRVIHSGAPDWPQAAVPFEHLPERYLLSVASAAPHKRVSDVVSGWARSQEGTSDGVHLVLVGGYTATQVEEHRQLAGIHADKLVHLGWVGDRRQLKWIYERATAMVLMSGLESFSMTPAEAGSVGCPLVLSDLPAHREVTQGNASFVPVGDTAALADVIREGLGRWSPGSKPWTWPVTWEDNARAFLDIFQALTPGRTRH